MITIYPKVLIITITYNIILPRLSDFLELEFIKYSSIKTGNFLNHIKWQMQFHHLK